MFHIKKNTVKILLCLCSLFTFSQNSSCDGIRYIENSFHDIITTADVFFGSNTTIGGKSQDLFMDVFEPSNDTEDNRPLIILAFGGAFVSGNKEKMHDLANAYARKGYVTASIDYRLYDKLAIIDSALLIDVVVKGIGDMRAAVRYFKQDFSENGNTFGIDTNHIFVGGISSGGIIACHIGLLDAGDNIPEYLETSIENNGGWEGSSSDNTQYSSEVAGVLSFSGGIKEIEWVSEKDVPVFAVHETGDDVVPYQRGPVKINFGSFSIPLIHISGGKEIYDALQNISIKSELISIDIEDHVSYFSGSTAEVYSDSIMMHSSRFIENIFCDFPVNVKPLQNNITIFPNPVQDYIIINSNAPIESISIYDNYGKNVLKTSERKISLQSFSKGTYFVKLQNSEGIVTKKIILK